MEKEIARILQNRQKNTIQREGFTHSAVLLPLLKQDSTYHILFTKRTNTVATHKGQISFPGGTSDEKDKSLLDTALRESFEEVKILPEDVSVLGSLDDIITVTSFVITPFVGVIPYPYSFQPNPDEIDELIIAPVDSLLDRNNFRADTTSYEFLGQSYPVYFFYYKHHEIWGATAKILKQFFDLVYNW